MNSRIKISALIICFLSFFLYANAEEKSLETQKYQELLESKDYETLISLADHEIEKKSFDKDLESLLNIMTYKAKAYTHQYKFDEGFIIYQEITEIAKKNNFTTHYVNGLSSQISIQSYRGNFAISKQLCFEILNFNGVEESTISNAYTSLSGIYFNEKKVDSCIFYAQKAVDIDLKTKNKSSLPFSLLSLGQGYKLKGNNKKALKIYIEATTFLRPGIDDFKMASMNRVIAYLFLRLNNREKAEEYVLKSIEVCKKEHIILNLSYGNFLLAQIYQQQGKIDESRDLFNETLKIFLDKNKNSRAVECYAQLAMLACNQNDLISANDLLSKAKELRKKIKNNIIINDLILAEVELFIVQKQFHKAYQTIAILENEDRLKTSPALKIRYLETLSRISKGNGEFEKAIEYYDERDKIESSLALFNQEYLMAEMEAKYNKIEDQKKIDQLSQDNQINSLLVEKKNLQLYGTLIILLLSLFAFLFILKQNKKISSALQEKEVLLKEIHHRVKNNLQIVSSLLNMQSRDVKEETAKSALKESKNRVHSMAMIHQELYQLENLVEINAKNFIEKLTKNLLQSYKTDQNIKLTNSIDNLTLDVDTSIPLGLIINELITNSLKYAFPNKLEGEIDLILKEKNDHILLTVKDNGIGIDSSITENQSSFGLKMVNIFAKKLNAEWEILNSNGTLVSLKIKNYKTT